MTAASAQVDAACRALDRMSRGVAPRRVTVSRESLDKLMAGHQARINRREASWDDEERQFRDMVASLAGSGYWPRASALLGRRVGLDEMSGRPRRMAARYDAAQTVEDNASHWAMADALSADAANSPAVRSILRNRSRYEVANNCYAGGVGLTIANDCIGTGPRLNIDSESSASISEAVADEVEAKFAAWCRAVNLADKLRTMRHARRQDGEAFALIVSNRSIEHEVKIGLKLIEAECCASFDLAASDRRIDGIRFDAEGNPVAYDILRTHPGETFTSMTGSMQYDIWPAHLVLHWYRTRRPGQHRGVPEIIPALPLYATLRRYTQATLDAAESAADMAILLHTQSGAEFEDPPTEAEPFSSVPFQRRMMIALPHGYDATQFDPKQPTQMYSNFKREIAGEIGRCENVSRNVVLLDSSESNFASGQLDHRTTYRQHDIDRDHLSIVLLDRIFAAWLYEASRISGYLPGVFRSARLPAHTWQWDCNELGDPLKIAKARAEELRTGQTSLPELYAARGRDWNAALRLAARGYGITATELLAILVKSIFSPPAVETADADDEPSAPPASQEQRVSRGDA